MNLTVASLDHSRLTILLALTFALGGVLVYGEFPSREDPQIIIREAVVTAFNPGMPPERMEQLVVRRLEEAIAQMEEVDEIESTVRAGRAIIHVSLDPRFFDLQPIWQDLRSRMGDAAEDLPAGTLGPYVDDDFGDVAVASIALMGRGFTPAELRRTARDVRALLYGVEGVGRIELHGVREERIYLETTNARLAQYDLDPALLAATLEEQNVMLPGGQIETDRRQILIEPTGHFKTLEEIERVRFPVPDLDRLVTLRDIFTVRRGYAEPPERLAYFNGEEAIVLAVTMQAGQNVLTFGPRLKERVRMVEADLPLGYRFQFATYQPDPVARAVGDVTNSLYQTLAIVLLVVVLFLGVRQGFIVGLMIPVTMLGTLVIMYILGIEMQRVSLASLIISLGMLVSNFVAVAEEIRQRLIRGERRREAAATSGNALSLPLWVATLTTVIAFTPPLLTQDESGEYTRSMSLVIGIAMLGSWVLAMTVVPLLCIRFVKVKESSADSDEAVQGLLFRQYRRLLEGLLRARLAVLAGLIALSIFGGWLISRLPEQFFPESERSEYMVYVDLPAGSSLTDTDRTVRGLVDWLSDDAINPEVERTVAYVGFGGPRFFLTVAPRDPAPHRAFLVVGVQDFQDVEPLVRRTRRYMLEEHGDVRGRITRPFLGYVETGLVELRLSGPHLERLYALGREAELLIQDIEGAIDVHNNWENRIVKAKVKVNQERARRAGLSSRDIAASLNAFFDEEPVTAFLEDDLVIPVSVRAEEAERGKLDRLYSVNVYSDRRGVNVPLLQVADLEPTVDFGRIDRRDQQRTVTIAAKHRDWSAAEFEVRLEDRLRDFFDKLPPPYRWEWGGETEASHEARAALFEHVPLALFGIVMLLIWQFNSFRRSLIVAFCIPMAVAGAAVGLLMTGSWFGFMAILGLLSLGGIIVNYSILMISSIDARRAEGMDDFEAVILGSQLRLRPVLMMGLTTLFGLVPLIVARDVLFYDMANAIVFGLGVGMLLTLAAVPVLYALLLRIPNPRRKKRAKK